MNSDISIFPSEIRHIVLDKQVEQKTSAYIRSKEGCLIYRSGSTNVDWLTFNLVEVVHNKSYTLNIVFDVKYLVGLNSAIISLEFSTPLSADNESRIIKVNTNVYMVEKGKLTS